MSPAIPSQTGGARAAIQLPYSVAFAADPAKPPPAIGIHQAAVVIPPYEMVQVITPSLCVHKTLVGVTSRRGFVLVRASQITCP